MKKVWVLEKFNTPKDMKRQLQSITDMVTSVCAEHETDDDLRNQLYAGLLKFRRMIDDNPEGFWSGAAGKTIYKQFCWEAQSTILSIRHKHPETQFRVVEAEIEDDATTWCDYVNPVENPGVYRYLLATL